MGNQYIEAKRKTFYFIGVTTAKSSIMKVFPAWSEHLGLDAEIRGFDFQPHDQPQKYCECVAFIKNDPLSLGALVTTHKLELLKAARHLFDGLGPYARQLHEVSSISKRGTELWGHAKDPITSGLALESFVAEGYWRESGGEVLILGAGGSSLALTIYLIEKAREGKDVPRRIVVANRSPGRLEEMRNIHDAENSPITFEYHCCPNPEDNDKFLPGMKPGSLVINATGLGKDAPGSPLTDIAVFPENGLVWDFNYRGDLVFLDQAEAQRKARNLTIEDGWIYFIHGWTQVIGEVFHISIPEKGQEFDKLSAIASAVRM
jgi:shikimate 5-dehydrogenase